MKKKRTKSDETENRVWEGKKEENEREKKKVRSKSEN